MKKEQRLRWMQKGEGHEEKAPWETKGKQRCRDDGVGVREREVDSYTFAEI